MGLLINNELIWLSIPRCASFTIEKALLNSNLNIQRIKIDSSYEDIHMHFRKSILYKEFGVHKTICIKRDWFDKWMSSVQHMFEWLEFSKIYTPIIKWKDIDNEFIYKTFNTDFLNRLYGRNRDDWDRLMLSLIKETKLIDRVYDSNNIEIPRIDGVIGILNSQNFYKENSKIDYEFDITEIYKFSDFIYDKFGERLHIEKLNASSKTNSKIVINDELKQWVWDKFEKPFQKRNKLI
jgi:hypothetical protein